MKYKIIITSGGTSERIDNVRKITNSSSGKLGCTIANQLMTQEEERIEKIYYVCSKTAVRPQNSKIEVLEIINTEDLKRTIETLLKKEKIDYIIHSMAVSDYTVDFVTTARNISDNIKGHPEKDPYDLICQNVNKLVANKISSNEEDLIIKLKRTPKIISLIKEMSPATHLIGFKLLDGVTQEELIEVATKLKEKNKCDLVVANDLSNIRKGNHLAYIVKDWHDYIPVSGKEAIANQLVSEMFRNDSL